MEDVIKVENIWKKYQIGNSRKLTEALSMLFLRTKPKEFWALKKVNLAVKKGQKVGIIGPNGSGKSTFLKILSQITRPTKGSAKVNGKVAALLELGAGFHFELTGKENVYLYGAILGLDKKQIDRDFDSIVEFSGIKKFIDMPVKHYSSGMYIRLAFSVVVHFDWDVLLIDEALAVGDAEFQKKSFDEIRKIATREKTVILVSHDLSSISKLCDTVVLFKNGLIEKKGHPSAVINYYLSHL